MESQAQNSHIIPLNIGCKRWLITAGVWVYYNTIINTHIFSFQKIFGERYDFKKKKKRKRKRKGGLLKL